MTLDARLDKMLGGAPTETAGEPLPDPQQTLGEQPDAEPVHVAQVGPIARKGARVVKDFLDPLFQKGAAMADRDKVKVTKPDAPEAAQIAPGTPAAAPVAPAPVQPAKAPPAPANTGIKAAPLDEAVKVQKAREDAIAAGTAVGKPPEKPFNTSVYDNESLAATVDEVAASAGVSYSEMSVRSIYQKALDQGVPEGFVRGILAGDMSSKVGGDQLAQNFAKMLTVFDTSAKRLDDMFTQMSRGELDDNGKLELRKQLALHQTLSRQVKGYQVDVARTMNVFKRVQDSGPGLKTAEIRTVLDELGGDNTLLALAKDYLDSPTRAGKNALVEKGAFAKAREAWFYTFQSNLLNDVSTHAVNLAGNAVFGPLQPFERAVATVYGRVRTLLPGTNPDRYTMEDNYAVSHGLINMIMDGLDLAAQSLRRDQSTGLKADQVAPQNPLTAEYWSETPLRIFGQEVMRTPDLRDSFAGKFLDGIGVVQSLPFRALSTVDEFFGGAASRWQLHSEAWTFANKEFDRLIAAGIPEDEATREVQRQVGQLLVERPADMQASIEAFRKMVTFQTDIGDYAAHEVPTGEFYWRAVQAFNNPFLKVLQPFTKTVTNIWIEGTARTPGLNLISPRFYDDWNKGGRNRDLAVARLAMGGGAITASSYLAFNNRLTGYGPSQREDRQALEKLGWQQYSVRFDEDEVSPANRERLSKFTKVTVGDGNVYVSYARFDPISMILAMGADTADAAKFHRGGSWDEDAESIVSTAAFTASNYITNLPLMQGIGELIKIGRSRSEDGGEKLVQIFDGLAKQYGNFLLTGTPALGLTNSSLVAHVERAFNPERSNTMPDKPDVPYGMRAFYENMQRLRSRIPGLSDGVPPALDSLGRPLVSTTFRDHWINWNPAVSARQGKRSEVDELLVSLDFGINEPGQTWDGVRLSATQFNRYKELYGQKVQLDGMNLERFLPQMIKTAEADAIEAGEVLTTGDKQKLIMQAVNKFRQLAKMRMIGDPEGMTVPGDDLGLSGDKLEFPDLKGLIDRNKTLHRIHGR